MCILSVCLRKRYNSTHTIEDMAGFVGNFPGNTKTLTLESYVYLYMLDRPKHNYKVREIYNWASIMLKFKTYFNTDIKKYVKARISM